MNRQSVRIANCVVEILSQSNRFLGLGGAGIAGTKVRSGRLPLTVFTQTYAGHELDHLQLLGVVSRKGEVRVRTKTVFRPLPVKLMRDHSFDPIHDASDWDANHPNGEGALDIVLRPAKDRFNGVEFVGFSYHFEYSSKTVPLFWLLDKGSWELGGDIVGATVFNQSSCSAPVCTFEAQTAWSTEGIMHWHDAGAKSNPVMTHNLPRWASHQAFDFQFKGSATLLGVYEKVDLIRTVLVRDAGKAELKTLDKHVFTQAFRYATSPKKILLNTQPRTATDQQNLWTWVFDEVADRARAEYGLKEEIPLPHLGQNYWVNWTLDTYYKDLLPAAKAIGIKTLFIDNVNRNDYSEYTGYPKGWNNMCQGHQYEPSEKVGGPETLKRFVADCAALGITPYSWTNNDQSVLSHNYNSNGSWFVRMEDARLKYGGAYTNGFAIWSFANEQARRNWVGCLKKSRRDTGLKGYMFDSFYNLGFMPVDYTGCAPRTHWREILQAFKKLQDTDIHFMIESLGPFGQVRHGGPTSYGLDNLFACYKICMGTGYTTIPTGEEKSQARPYPAPEYYRILAYMAQPGHPLFFDGVRIDKLFTDAHKRALADYYAALPFMQRRYLQEDGEAVIWHDRNAKRATVWNFAARKVALTGKVIDLTLNRPLPKAKIYKLEPCHTYALIGAELPTTIT